MPLIAREDRKVLLTGALLLVLLVVAAIVFAPNEDRGDVPTTYSSGSRGAKAAYLLLRESGYQVERWEQPVADLPSGPGNTLMLVSPSQLLSAPEAAKLFAFIESGGRVISVGLWANLPKNQVQENAIGKLTWKRFKALTPSPITHIAPEITMATETSWAKTDSSWIHLYGDAEHLMVVKNQIGKGEIIWWGGPTPLTNAGLKEPGNLEFFLACIGDRQHTRVLWDEYVHGHSRVASPAGPSYLQIKWLGWQFAALAVFILLTYSRHSGPLRPAVTESRLSPLEFVETLGGVYERAKAGSVSVEVYYQRFRYWLTRRLGIAPNASIEELERQVRERWRWSDPDFAATLQRCESARFDHFLSSREALRLVQRLHDFAAQLKLFPMPPQEKK